MLCVVGILLKPSDVFVIFTLTSSGQKQILLRIDAILMLFLSFHIHPFNSLDLILITLITFVSLISFLFLS